MYGLLISIDYSLYGRSILLPLYSQHSGHSGNVPALHTNASPVPYKIKHKGTVITEGSNAINNIHHGVWFIQHLTPLYNCYLVHDIVCNR